MKPSSLCFAVCTLLLYSLPLHANNKWSGWTEIADIYTYNSKDTLYVYIKGHTCPNQKKYFTISGSFQDNAPQLISMVLSAKMAKSKVNVMYDPDLSESVCYMTGLRIGD